MKPGLLISLLLPLLAAGALAQAAPSAAPLTSSPTEPAPATATPAAAIAPASAETDAATSEPAAPAAPAASAPAPAAALPTIPPAAPMTMAPATSTGSLLQTIAALVFVLALLMALAWGMKRYGPKAMGNNSKMRVISSLNLGGRERIVLVEVGDQWIVVGASPGRINALATVPRQDSDLAPLPASQNGPAAANFSEWLKQTIEKRNGK